MISSGDRFGDYTVVRRLGKGGMGEVWLLESSSGAQVAAKILDPATAGDHEVRKRFLREAQLALGVKHPNLVETYDVGEDPDTGLCYILMEFVPGGTLADYLKTNGALPIEDAVAVVEAIASVLEVGRQKGVVHRDIKPANIMFAGDGTPKLSDLGIARGGSAGVETTTVTQTGMMIGTPAYMAPEQMLDSHNVDTRADIYSLGVVFFEMLTGERPNKDDTVVQLLARAVRGEPLPDVRTLRPEVSASLAQLLSMMVVPDKDGRISTPGQITNALAIIERGGTFGADAEGVRQSREVKRAALRARRARERRILAAALAGSILLAIAGGALALHFLLPADKPGKTPQSAHADGTPPAVPTNTVQATSAPKDSSRSTATAPRIVDVVRTNIVEIVRTNGISRSVDGASANSEWISKAKYGLKWLHGFGFGERRKTIRICMDVSHGGHGSYNAQREMNEYYLFDAPKKAEWVSCWYDLTKDALSDVNVLWISETKIDFSAAEIAAVDGFLNNNGAVIIFYDPQQPASRRLLGHYGLKVTTSEASSHRRCDFCGTAEVLLSVHPKCWGNASLAVNDGRNAAFVEMVPLLVTEGKGVVAAAGLFGPNERTGKIFCIDHGILNGRKVDDNRKLLDVLLSSAVELTDRQLGPSVAVRKITDAAFVREACGFRFLCGPNTVDLADKTVAFLNKMLPRYLAAGGLYDGNAGKRTYFMTTDGFSGYVPYGEGVRSWSGCRGGFPQQEWGLAGALAYEMMSVHDGSRMAYGNGGVDVNGLLVDRIYRDAGLGELADASMEEWIERARKVDPTLNKYDFRVASIRDKKDKILSSGTLYGLRKGKFFAAMRELIGSDAEKWKRFFSEWGRQRPRWKRDADEVDALVAALEGSVGGDVRSVLSKYRITPLGIPGGDSVGQTAGTAVYPVVQSNPYSVRARDVNVDKRIRRTKVGESTWFYYLVGNDAVLWRGNSGYNNSTRSCVEPEPTGRLEIPAELDGHRVVRIESLSFFRCKGLRSVRVPEGVTELCGWGCFYGCGDLKSIELPNSLRRIDSGSSAFDQCSALESIDLKDCKFLDGTAFQGCIGLRRIDVSAQNEFYRSQNGVLYSKDLDRLVAYPKNLQSLAIPKSVRVIGGGACVSCAFTGTVEVPAHVESIEREAFHLCGASRISVLGARWVMDNAFSACNNLIEVRFSDRLLKIGHSLFDYDAKLKNVFFGGDAPQYPNDSRYTVFGEKAGSFLIGVRNGSRGWKRPGAGDLPSVWPIEGLESSRPISFVGKRAGPVVQGAETSGSSFTPSQIGQMRDSDGWNAMRKAAETMFKGWRMSPKLRAQLPKPMRRNNRGRDRLGYLSQFNGKADVLRTWGVGPVILEHPSSMLIKQGQRLHFWVCADSAVTIMVRASAVPSFIADCQLFGVDWKEVDVDLSPLAGKTVSIVLGVTEGIGSVRTVHWQGIEVR